ncbi:hypothetical protein CY34DRAFT_17147 [Suillus luteus UH-Slu-Lm8-n1]|uniref:Uncharacterized protein n=1 Tax=Suillus luteus UH-Slu-Lm8-n1 TaxID=930992 RepID=A0A0D0ALW5_9AGAM|nr:hypothetical protein CY34DRAFT_17147 [Suillus luteus UH-Slu-Lm8-n1]
MPDCPPMVFDQPYPIRFDLDGHTDTSTLTTSPFCALSHMCDPDGALVRLESPSPIRVDADSPTVITPLHRPSVYPHISASRPPFINPALPWMAGTASSPQFD